MTSLAQQIRIAEKGDDPRAGRLEAEPGAEGLRGGAVLETMQAEQELTRARNDHLRAEHSKAQYALARTLGRLAREPLSPGR